MTKREISKIAGYGLLAEQKLYIQRAKVALPFLVRQANAAQPIYYSDLAKLMRMPNPRNLNYVLGAIGRALNKLSKRANIEIPPIQCLVINKRNDLPGEGISGFIKTANFLKISLKQKRLIVNNELTKIYTFNNWDWVLQQLELNPITPDLTAILNEAKKIIGGGESEQHKKFKEYISRNPGALGLNSNLKNAEQEYKLPSTDCVDVLFVDGDLKIGIEVKSDISNTADILRGLFQCVKYKHLLEAEQIINNQLPNARVLLALQGHFPKEFHLVKSLLGIEVIDKINYKI